MRSAFKHSPYLTESPGGVTKLCFAFPSSPSPGACIRHAEKGEMPYRGASRAFPVSCLETHDESVSRLPDISVEVNEKHRNSINRPAPAGPRV
jgi:hypothetical protein